MKGTWLANVRGYVGVKLIGGEPETFLNAATAQRIGLWNISFTKGGELSFGVTVPEFFKLRPLLRESGSRSRILSKHGLPFQLAKLSRRKTFAAGMLAFAIALFVLSTFVWNVKIEGNSAIPPEKIRAAAKEEGLYSFQSAFRLKSPDMLAKKLALRLPEAAWIGVDKQGTTVTITVVDSTRPEKKPLTGPSNLVATTDAVVTRIIAESGRPKVERNDRVRKGDVLISGFIGNETNNKVVSSKGKVMGLVWHEYRISSPLETKARNFTGASQERKFLVIGSRALQISGYRGESYELSKTLATVKRAKLWDRLLPFGTMIETEREVTETVNKLTPAEAKEAGLAQARSELLRGSGPEASIKEEKILHERTENGKVMLTVYFEVEQSIAVERPIG
ncbi:sporulation protein YqfD [Cohnella soli]|uniref:Sporulation protein YqfD n=1 Tax=Cohnella soli TaxID=425005 RepID=A0ABW0HV73_9BACL